MTVDARDASIVRSSIELAHSLGIGVVAEGVETGSICDLLREAGCDEAQGYHFARPMPPDQLLAWMCDRDPIAC
jgi:EAL domain-containing protein (putative c-di-GMP-specific phosphodiesterase class I)